MTIRFTDNELKYIKTDVMGWPIKNECPYSIRRSIEEKKKLLESQLKAVVKEDR